MKEHLNDDLEKLKEIATLTSQLEAAQRLSTEISGDKIAQKLIQTELPKQAEHANKSMSNAYAEIRNLTRTIDEMRVQARNALNSIQEDTRKANSESAFAFNAKGNAEEHAKAIAQTRGTVDATFAGLTEIKKNTEEHAQAVMMLRGAAENDAKAVADAKSTTVRDSATVTAAAERVAAVMPAIDRGSQDANAITAAKSAAEANAAAILLLHTQISETTAKAAIDGASIVNTNVDAKTLVAAMEKASETAQTANLRVIKYEEELEEMREAFKAMQIKLEGLLPHATSVGLASAFHNQKIRFSKPQPYWLGLFVTAIVSLLIAACYGLPASNETWDSLFRHFVNRLPIVAPLVWLAIYAGHHYNMALRMEEDYAFKEAVSTAFEGYKREMLGIPVREGSPDNPLVTLCENVLKALAERPGRIYEGRTDVVTPLSPVGSILKDTVAEVMKPRGGAAQ